MYVCLCKGVTDTQIRSAAREGRVCRMRDLQRCMGVAATCGRCAPCAHEILSECLRERDGEAEDALVPMSPAPAV